MKVSHHCSACGVEVDKDGPACDCGAEIDTILTDPVETAKEAVRDAVARYLNDPGSATKHETATRALDALADAVLADFWQDPPAACPYGRNCDARRPCSACADS